MVLATAFMLPACDNSVDPFVEADRYFTLWGYLDTASDTQFVRVVPFRREIGEPDERELDVDVTALELGTGLRFAWRDSVVEYDDGSIGHVFHAPFRPVPGRTYRVRVRRSDGAETWAETLVPTSDRARIAPPDQFSPGSITQDVTWESVDDPPFRVEVWYRFASVPPSLPFHHEVITYEDVGTPVDDGWRVSVRLSEDAASMNVGSSAELLGIGMRLTMSDDEWRPPGGVFDRELLVQPGVLSNVEHGYGFVGAVNHFAAEWVLNDLVTRRLGFNAPD